MADNNATILIPDISGFTEFMTTTELTHASNAINVLIEAILEAVGNEYDVSEIEGDAVLLIRKGQAPSRKEILGTCLKIFNAFHFRRKWMQQHTVCPCGACISIVNLTLKFVGHHGPLAEMNVGRFVKHAGPEMIVAHRLLKNSIENDEYLLLTEKLLQQAADESETVEMEWIRSSEEYASIGKVEYRFALLNEVRKHVPEPPPPQTDYHTDDTPYIETSIAANIRDVYMAMMDIPGRPQWMPGLQKVEQDIPQVFVGSIHYCTFEDYRTIVSPLRMVFSAEGIIYAESCAIKEMNLSMVHEYVFRNIDETSCVFAARYMNAGDSPVPAEINDTLYTRMQQMGQRLKDHCEKMNGQQVNRN